MVEPNKLEVAGAQVRQEIADRLAGMLREAEKACGTGATAYGYWTVTDTLKARPDRVVYCCRRPGHTGWHPPSPGRGELLTEAEHPGFLIGGERVFPPRYVVYWSYLEPYHPKTAEALATAREKRQARKVEKDAQALPLFAAQIRAGELVPAPRTRKRGE